MTYRYDMVNAMLIGGPSDGVVPEGVHEKQERLWVAEIGPVPIGVPTEEELQQKRIAFEKQVFHSDCYGSPRRYAMWFPVEALKKEAGGDPMLYLLSRYQEHALRRPRAANLLDNLEEAAGRMSAYVYSAVAYDEYCQLRRLVLELRAFLEKP